MQLAQVPQTVVTANQDVLGSLRAAASNTARAQLRVDGADRVPAGTQQLVTSALASAQHAVAGVEALGAANLLDGTFQRYASHSVRHLEQAAQLLGRTSQPSGDALALLTTALFDAEVATRLGTEAGDRSLARPSPKAIERATGFAGAGGGSADGPVWVDGAWLDSLGNPVRSGGDHGPDGTGSGWDGAGERGDGGGFTGPDGDTHTGF